MIVDISTKVERSGYEFMQHMVEIAQAYKASVADGWQPGQDIPKIVLAVVAKGPGLISSMSSFDDDLAESKILFATGINIGAYDVAEVVIGS
jgi:hypothetical protein